MTIVEYTHRRLAVCLVVLTAFVGPSNAVAQNSTEETATEDDAVGPVLPDDRFAEIADEFGAAGSSAEAVSSLYRLDQLSSMVPGAVFRRTLREAGEAVDSPTGAFGIERRLFRNRLDRDIPLDREASVGEKVADWQHQFAEDHGCLVDWSVVGPFDNDSMDGFEARLAPERGEAGPYEGKHAKVDWRSYPEFRRGCHVHVGEAMHSSSSSVAYLASRIEVDRAETRRLLIGASGAYRVWLNGKLVAERDEDRGFAVDGEAWELPLKAGANRIVVKLGSTRTGSMSLMARIVGSELEPVDFRATAVPVTNDNGAEIGALDAPDGLAPVPTDQGRLAEVKACAREKAEVDVGTRVDCLVTWSRLASEVAADPWEDIADNLVAAVRRRTDQSGGSVADAGIVEGTGPDAGGTVGGGDSEGRQRATADVGALSPRAIARLAMLYDDQHERLQILRLAERRATDDPVVALKLAEAEASSLEDTYEHRRRDRLEKIRQQHPKMWPATLELASWYTSHGFGGRALKLVEGVNVDRRMERPALVMQLANLESRHGSRSRARELSKRVAGLRRLSTGWVRRRVDELVADARYRAALAWVEQQRVLNPWSAGWVQREANLHRVRGEHEEALAEIDAMLERIPGTTSLYRLKADILAASNDRDAAIASIEEALTYETQNQQLEEYLRFLQPDQRSFHEPWIVDNVRERAADQDPSNHSLDTIIDQTIVQVSPNGLSQRVVQVVQRVNDAEGVSDARSESVGFRSGDEYVDVMSVRVHKPDGRVLQDYNEWTSGGSRKGSSYYNDRKYRNIRAQNVEKGDLVEFRYRLQESASGNFRGDYFGDVSYVQSSRPVGYARYVVEAPETWELYFRAPTHDHTRVSSRPGDAEAPAGFRVQGFEVSDIPAVNTDPDQPGYTDVYDYLMVSNKETWDEIGSWWWELIDEQLITSDPIKQKVAELTEGLESDRAKMEAIHNWVVKNTRYLHLGLGVHGWKPYKTTRAFKNKFGDCKDKSSLLKVMLEEAGIPTRLVLVRTRDLGHVERRPASMHIFNHAIGYVPQFDLFLDPTAEFNGTTELTPMDQGAQALVVQDGGDAEFVTLPIDDPDANRTETEMTVELPEPASEGGNATVRGNIRAYGQHAVRYRRNLQDESRRDQDFEKQLVDTYPGATLESATYRHLGNLERPAEVDFSFSGGRFLRGGGSSGYVYPSGVERDLLERYAEKSERHQDLTIRVPFVNQMTITYELPEGYAFGNLPEGVQLDSDFGQLRIDYDLSAEGGQGRRLEVGVRYGLSKQRIPVERYGEFRSFVSTMTDELNRTIEIVPAEGSASRAAVDQAGESHDG